MIYEDERTHEDFFTAEEESKIVAAISAAERVTSGQIRLHIEDRCEGPLLERAAYIFRSIGMEDTEERNGVILYFAVIDHEVAIYGDTGVDRVVPDHFWEDVLSELLEDFKRHNFLHGTVAAIEKVGNILKEFFPWHEGVRNEQPDEISFGHQLRDE